MGAIVDVARGAVAGAVGTWVMDLITTGIVSGQSKAAAKREAAARPNGKSSVENLVDRLPAWTGIDIPAERRPLVQQLVHFGLGVVPGAAYALLRRTPLTGTARGAAMGALLWALNDEFINSKLGLAGPFEAYPLETHLRGLVGHVALGITTDTTIELLGG